MRALTLCLLLSAGLCAQTRFARLAGIDGAVEIQIHPTEPWRPALRNTPLLESSSVRTGSASRAEIELDEGSVLRLAENSFAELSDYTRLSTGQRITHIWLDRGIAYFAGESTWRDALMLTAPGAQVSIRRGTRIRLEAAPGASRLAVLEGEARLASDAAELSVQEGRTLTLDPARPQRFDLRREIAELASDSWSVNRDKVLAGDPSRDRLPGLRYGVRDLDASGEWIDTAEFGLAWKPAVPQDWAPFRDGKWQWYEGLGYTWIGAESWGWLPYHYGRWMLQPALGWLWAPGQRRAFQPGEVYWMRSANLVGWGPLAPGENWSGAGTPTLYLKANTTFARPEPREIDPTGFGPAPKDPLAVARFTDALPPLRINSDRIEFARLPDRAGVIRLVSTAPPAPPPAPVERPRPQVTQAPRPAPPAPQVAMPAPVVERPAAAQPLTLVPMFETFYIAPSYRGIIVMNPPEKKKPKRGHRDDPEPWN